MHESVPDLHHTPQKPDKLLAPDEVIVIVDDDASIREPLRIFLESRDLLLFDTSVTPAAQF